MEDDFSPMTRRRSASSSQSASHRPNGSLQAGLTDFKISEETSRSHQPSSSDEMELGDLMSDEELDDDEETGLTHSDRGRRRQKKRRNTQLDERVAGNGGGGGAGAAKTEKQLATAALLHYYLVNAALIALWYSFSIAISVYNKWMFSSNNLDFHYPLFTTSIHMLVQFALASSVLYFMPQFRPSRGSITPHGHNYQRIGEEDDAAARQGEKPVMTKWFYFTRIGPCGTATALDIGLGNFSLRYISLTFYTMCKSSVLGFVLIFAFIFRLEKPSWRLILIILVMSGGVVMMVAGETAFNALGFVLVMTASFCSGFRWSLSQILLLRNAATSNPFSSIFFLTPIMFLALFLLAIPIEGPKQLAEGFHILAESKGTFFSLVILLFPGSLAFLMVAAEFALLKRTSVVTLSVCGIFKEVLTILAAGVIFKDDDLSPINVSGLCITIASIAAYNWLKYTRMRNEAQKEAHQIFEGDGEPANRHGERRKSSGAVDDASRQSLEALMRESLTLRTDLDGGPGKARPNGSLGPGVSQSPVKRPEDLD